MIPRSLQVTTVTAAATAVTTTAAAAEWDLVEARVNRRVRGLLSIWSFFVGLLSFSKTLCLIQRDPGSGGNKSPKAQRLSCPGSLSQIVQSWD